MKKKYSLADFTPDQLTQLAWACDVDDWKGKNRVCDYWKCAVCGETSRDLDMQGYEFVKHMEKTEESLEEHILYAWVEGSL